MRCFSRKYNTSFVVKLSHLNDAYRWRMGLLFPHKGCGKDSWSWEDFSQKGNLRFSTVVAAGSSYLEKLLLCCFNAMHNFNTDTVTIRTVQGSVKLGNSSEFVKQTSTGTCLTHNVEQQRNLVGGFLSTNPPLRQVLHMDVSDSLVQNDKSSSILDHISNTPEGTKSDVNKVSEDVTWTMSHCEGEMENRMKEHRERC